LPEDPRETRHRVRIASKTLPFRVRLRYPRARLNRAFRAVGRIEIPMGRFDRRNSMKMKRRRAQAKKKARVKKVAAKAAPARTTAPAKKSRARAEKSA
jgi:hypothetical protein